MGFQGMKNMKAEKNGIAKSEQRTSANPKEVFVELIELLEQYSPRWYTEQHHSRALTALRMLDGSKQTPRAPISAY